jgi:hypothetical protein
VTYGGDSGNGIFVLYWRCPLIRVSVIRGSTVLPRYRMNGVLPSAFQSVFSKHKDYDFVH